jgi:recombination protein RecT
MQLLESKREALATVLPKHVKVDRLVKVTLMAVSRSPTLLACEVNSIFSAIWQASELGLDIAGPMPQCYLIPRKNKNRNGAMEATFMLGYGGLADLARRHRDVSHIKADCIYRGEHFKHDKVSGKIEHDGSLDTDTKDENLIGAWACAFLRDGSMIPRVLPRKEIEARRGRSAARESGPWQTDYAAMCRKTALRALLTSRQVPLSIEAMEAIEREDEELDPEVIRPAVVRRGSKSGDPFDNDSVASLDGGLLPSDVGDLGTTERPQAPPDHADEPPEQKSRRNKKAKLEQPMQTPEPPPFPGKEPSLVIAGPGSATPPKDAIWFHPDFGTAYRFDRDAGKWMPDTDPRILAWACAKARTMVTAEFKAGKAAVAQPERPEDDAGSSDEAPPETGAK